MGTAYQGKCQDCGAYVPTEGGRSVHHDCIPPLPTSQKLERLRAIVERNTVYTKDLAECLLEALKLVQSGADRAVLPSLAAEIQVPVWIPAGKLVVWLKATEAVLRGESLEREET